MKLWNKALQWAHDFSAENCIHEGHQYAHIAYFAAIAAEGHGVYAKIGGVLFIISVVERYYHWRQHHENEIVS